MLHIFCDPQALQDDLLTISGETANHIRRALRMKAGEELTASLGDGRLYRFVIEELAGEDVLCRLCGVTEADAELPVQVLLFQGLPKADKMDTIVQKAVELGAAEVIPVECERCITKLTPEKKEKRRARWQAIAESAAEQSHRALVPQVGEVLRFADACHMAQERTQARFIPYELQQREGTAEALARIREGDAVSVFIGPEGGFTEEEIETARAHGVEPITLGRRILRTETASAAFLSFLIYRFEIQEKPSAPEKQTGV